ncbi:MAG: hypothetical protein QNJ16_14820 [Rhodobacter sp.]|nr:hypothetical protein [Rhodobacter sp.]
MLEAHARDDHRALVSLYTQAAEVTGDHDAACFFLTQAYVFALDTGHSAASGLRRRLVVAGRET